VHIAGEFPRTRQTVVLNRVSLRPGDIIDMREVRNSERRLKASQLFAGTQNDGEPPRIVVRPPDLSSLSATSTAQPPAAVRGQEPDAATARPLAAGNATTPALPSAGPGSAWR
jgi:outer membrane protein insertion porin family